MGLFDCDCVCAKPPDYTATAEATEEAAKYARESAKEDLAFRKQVYEESKPQIQQLRDLAATVAQQQLDISNENRARAAEQIGQYKQVFQPQERMMAADALAAQYLSPQDQQAVIQIMNDPNLSDTERQQQLRAMAMKGETAMADTLRAQADAYETAMGLRADEIYARERARAMDDEARARLANEAAINSSYGMQARDLSRHGFNANRIAQAAANLANQQALARIQANNQMYGLTAGRLRQAEDMANAYRYQGQDVARQKRDTAKETAANKYASLRAGVAGFGRNMPNTAGQAYGLATNAGSSAVGNQGAAANAALPYAQFVAQGTGNQLTAANLQQQGALGLGQLMSQDYRTAQSGYNNMQSSSLGSILGPVAGVATSYFLGAV